MEHISHSHMVKTASGNWNTCSWMAGNIWSSRYQTKVGIRLLNLFPYLNARQCIKALFLWRDIRPYGSESTWLFAIGPSGETSLQPFQQNCPEPLTVSKVYLNKILSDFRESLQLVTFAQLKHLFKANVPSSLYSSPVNADLLNLTSIATPKRYEIALPVIK